MSTTTQPAKPKRRWYQFSLLTLLVVMTLSCFGFAWIGGRMQRARENRHRVAAALKEVVEMQNLGGWVESEYEKRRPPTWLEEKFDDPGDADDPVSVLKVTGLKFGANATDADLELLKHLLHIQTLKIGESRYSNVVTLPEPWKPQNDVTDAGLEHLKRMKNLRELWLGDTKVTEKGVKRLQQALPNCTIYTEGPDGIAELRD